MKSVRIGVLKDELSKHIRAVEKGASYLITDRDRPVAQLVPPGEEDACEVTPAERRFATVHNHSFKATRKKVDSTRVLRLERGDR